MSSTTTKHGEREQEEPVCVKVTVPTVFVCTHLKLDLGVFKSEVDLSVQRIHERTKGVLAASNYKAECLLFSDNVIKSRFLQEDRNENDMLQYYELTTGRVFTDELSGSFLIIIVIVIIQEISKALTLWLKALNNAY